MATVLRAKRHRREGHHGITVARSPLVTSSTPAVWTHVVCSSPILWLLPTTTTCSHPRWLRPWRHAEEQHLAQRPDVIRQSSRHGRRPGLPALGGAAAVGELELRQEQV